jgi:hypothetical protein
MGWFGRRRRTAVTNGLKYYVYISDAKVDMLFAQVPRSFVATIAAELTVDLKVVAIALKERPSDENRYSRLKIVAEYLRAHANITTLTASEEPVTPNAYFAGELDMLWGIRRLEDGRRKNRVAYFTGRAPGYVVGLVGSPHHVLGVSAPPSTVGTTPASFGPLNILPKEMSALSADKGEEPESASDARSRTSDAASHALRSVQMLEHNAHGQSQRLEFLAKTLAYDDGHDIFAYPERPRLVCVLGSPIYVAMA